VTPRPLQPSSWRVWAFCADLTDQHPAAGSAQQVIEFRSGFSGLPVCPLCLRTFFSSPSPRSESGGIPLQLPSPETPKIDILPIDTGERLIVECNKVSNDIFSEFFRRCRHRLKHSREETSLRSPGRSCSAILSRSGEGTVPGVSTRSPRRATASLRRSTSRGDPWKGGMNARCRFSLILRSSSSDSISSCRE